MKALLCVLALTPASLMANSAVNAGYLWSSEGRSVTIVAGDDVPDPVQIFPFGVKAQNFTFVVTNSDSEVLLYTESNVFDLDGAGVGTCRVYGFAWAGEFDRPTGVNIHDLTATEGFDLTSNRITIDRVGAETVDGGWVLNDQTGGRGVRLYLADNPAPFRVYTYNEASTDTDYAFIITDEEGTVLGFPPGNTIDLSAAPPGVCRVYGISFTGTLDTTTGVNVSEVTADSGNQELSQNSITAYRFEGSKPSKRERRRRW